LICRLRHCHYLECTMLQDSYQKHQHTTMIWACGIPMWHELALGGTSSIILVCAINSCNTSNKGTTLHLITISL
jgi:hypothetical protein